ncbi:MAG: hypothetical protein L3J63_06135 [Geopsychrobacter sp.]|nr:hypothetical protein [Geopsychrobacter sp.]
MFCKILSLIVLLLLIGTNASAAAKPAAEATIYQVTGYAYDPGESGGDIAVGRVLCATRCNAFSSDYRNYTEAGGWRVIKIASDQEVRVDIDNPFIEGHCLCTADQYKVIVNSVSFPDRTVLD